MGKNILKNKYLNWIKYIISPLILVYIAYYIDMEKIYYAFQNFNPYYLLIAFLVYIFAILFGLFPIYFLYKPLLHIRIFDFLKYRNYSIAFGLFTPMKLGELSLSLIFKKKYKRSLLESGTIILLDKLISLLVVFLIFFTSYFTLVYLFDYSYLSYFHKHILLVMALFLVFLAIGFILLYSKKVELSIKKIVSMMPFFHKHLSKYINSFLSLYESYKKHPSALLMDFLVTFLSMIIIVVPSYIIFLSLGLNINFIYLLFISSAAGFFSLIPFTLSGLGIREAFVIYLYSLVHIPPQISLAIMLIFLFYRYFVPFLLIIFFNFISKTKNKKISK